MDPFRKAFLLIVGAAVVAYEEAAKSIKEATKSLEEQREKLSKATKIGA
jgi:ribosomal protein L9